MPTIQKPNKTYHISVNFITVPDYVNLPITRHSTKQTGFRPELPPVP